MNALMHQLFLLNMPNRCRTPRFMGPKLRYYRTDIKKHLRNNINFERSVNFWVIPHINIYLK